jgi:putative NAD(P)H nitroreductase
MEFAQIVTARRAVRKYDPKHVITDAELAALFEKVALVPSAFNLQHARFVVVREPARKAELRQAAFGQEQVEAASAAIVVVGKLTAYQDAPAIYGEAPPEVRDVMLPMIEKTYTANSALQRDEAIRSASLAAMTLMYAACDMGYATGPMGGFDPQAVSRLVGLDERHIPVMLVVIGKQLGDIRPRDYRHPVGQVVKRESLDGPGLGQQG